jgi:uncharacterized protein YebE (UPF0316 family)
MFPVKILKILILIGSGVALLPQAGWSIPWDLVPQNLFPLAIYLVRTFDLTMATLRMLSVVRGKATVAWIIGFIQASFFILGIAGVLSNLNNPLNIIAYAAGFATGNVIGIFIESKVAPGHSLLRIISPERGNLISEELHNLGRGATEVSAQGKHGMVSLIYCYVPRREVRATKNHILRLDPEVFITVENVRELRGGWRA